MSGEEKNCCDFHSHQNENAAVLYALIILFLYTVSGIACKLQIYAKRTCQICDYTFIIVGIPASADHTINFAETRKNRILIQIFKYIGAFFRQNFCASTGNPASVSLFSKPIVFGKIKILQKAPCEQTKYERCIIMR